MDLPRDIWELICKFIDEDNYRLLEPLSLVSTSLLDITNRARTTFVLTYRTKPLLHRFSRLKRISFESSTGFRLMLQQNLLASSYLESITVRRGIESFPEFEKLGTKMLSNVKELNCSRVEVLCPWDFVSIGECFPLLEKLDLSYTRITDTDIISLSLILKGLLMINISGNKLITDKSLVALSQNCVLLREVILKDCDAVWSDCLEDVLRNLVNLESLAVRGWKPSQSLSNNILLYGRCLSEIDLSGSYLHDKLPLIASAKFPLKKLSLSNSYFLTFDGILLLLSTYQTLVHLDLEGTRFLTDSMVVKLGKFLRCLTFVNLSKCSKLTGLAFFSMIEKCASLKCIRMEDTDFGVEAYYKELHIKSRIKSVYLSRNRKLRDECLKKLSCHCPFIETLELNHSTFITSRGIFEVLRNCRELRCLDIRGCTAIESLGPVDFELPKLISLRACETKIDDGDLDMISKRCRGLLQLDMRGCYNVRAHGVRKVVESCIRLREIGLNQRLTDGSFLIWMVSVNLSLKRIVPQQGNVRPTQGSFRKGCVFCPPFTDSW